MLVVFQPRTDKYHKDDLCCAEFEKMNLADATARSFQEKLNNVRTWYDERHKKFLPLLHFSAVRTSADAAVWDTATDRCICSRYFVNPSDNQPYRWFVWQPLPVDNAYIGNKFELIAESLYSVNQDQLYRAQLAANLAYCKNSK